ncbi:hypothetical protein ACPEEZ_12110 [Frigoribacterium sp. 2-23]|uniref:hypothetical protein n=1 Tax=Frigoribacterium sp. 2-23 TaxID=3415006 RepID=UPI003C6EFE84
MDTIQRTTIAIATALLVGLTAAGCTTDGTPGANGTTASSAPPVAATSTPAVDPSTTPAPSPSAAPASIPTACTDVVDSATYAATMGSTPLNDPDFFAGRPMGQLTPSAPPAGASAGDVVTAATQLDCGWRDPRADITGLFVSIGGLGTATEADYQAWLLDRGNLAPVAQEAGASYSCAPGRGGTVCQLAYTESFYGVDIADTVLMRDGVVVSVSQANHPTNNLMGALVTRIWG